MTLSSSFSHRRVLSSSSPLCSCFIGMKLLTTNSAPFIEKRHSTGRPPFVFKRKSRTSFGSFTSNFFSNWRMSSVDTGLDGLTTWTCRRFMDICSLYVARIDNWGRRQREVGDIILFRALWLDRYPTCGRGRPLWAAPGKGGCRTSGGSKTRPRPHRPSMFNITDGTVGTEALDGTGVGILTGGLQSSAWPSSLILTIFG